MPNPIEEVVTAIQKRLQPQSDKLDASFEDLLTVVREISVSVQAINNKMAVLIDNIVLDEEEKDDD